MNLQEIKRAVLSGQTVHWANRGYVVHHDCHGEWSIVCTMNCNAIGLTWRDGVTLNGRESDFFIGEN